MFTCQCLIDYFHKKNSILHVWLSYWMCHCLMTQPNILLKKYDFRSFCSFYCYYSFSFITFIFLRYAILLYSIFGLHTLFTFRKLFQKIFSRIIHLANFTENFFLDVTFGKLEFCWDLRAVAWDFLISFLIHTDRYFLERLLPVLLENLCFCEGVSTSALTFFWSSFFWRSLVTL